MNDFLKKAGREPLVHFLALGALLFLAYGWVSKGGDGNENRVVITQEQVAAQWSIFVQARHRAPTAEEWDRLVRERVRQAVYYREAKSLGLDQNDLIIERRLQQKMQFYVEDTAGDREPTGPELDEYFRAHAADYRTDQRLTFRQTFLDPQKRGMLENRYDALRASDIAKIFGNSFAAALTRLPAGQWRGPIGSAYGMHLVFVMKRLPASVPPLAQVRDIVRRDWMNAHRLDVQDAYYRNLLARYKVTIEMPPAGEKRTVSLR